MKNEDGEYLGMRYRIDVLATENGGGFVGRYALINPMPLGEGAASVPPISGVADLLHPTLDSTWATENEALGYATEAAHHAIEVVVTGRTQGQGNRSAATARRMTGD